VTLRNLNINGVDVGNIGVDFQNGSALFVERCVIENNTTGNAIGIHFSPPSGVTAELHVTDSVIKNNGNGSSGGGIIIQPSGSGSAHVVIENTKVENNTYGIFANQYRRHRLNPSSYQGQHGSQQHRQRHLRVHSRIDHGQSLSINSSSLINGGSGILAQGSGGPRVSYGYNGDVQPHGLSATGGGTIYSYGNNRLTGNASDGVTPVTGGFALK